MIRVQICGVAGTGKTTIAHIIQEALRAQGIVVEEFDDGESNAYYTNHLKERVRSGNGGRNVVQPVMIEEVRTRRVIIED